MLPIAMALTPAAEAALLHDARAAHDVASLRLGDYEPGGRPAWILAAVSPGPRSGSGTIPGAYIDGKTGTLVQPPGARPVMVKEGTWKALSASPPGGHPASGTFSWNEPPTSKRILDPEDLYSPFIHGGALLFRPVAGKADIEQFGAARVIFTDWSAQVAPAFAFHEANPFLLDPGPQTASVKSLVQITTGQNLVLAAVAFRVLLQLGLAQPDWVRAQILRVSGPLGAVFGFLTVAVAGPNLSRPFAHETVQALDTASEPTLRAVSLGAFSAALFPSPDPAVMGRAKVVAAKAKQRLAAAGVAVDKDPQLSFMFGRMGV
jgi:hypothetical protein